METSVNRTNALTEIHLCYEVEGSYVLMRSPTAMCVLLLLFLALLSVVTVCGNLLVIISVTYFKQLHTPTNYLTLSLAVADLLVGLLVCPLTTKFSTSICQLHWDLFCNIRQIFETYLCLSSILNLCCISIDRYYAVCQPLTYRTKINDHVVAIMISVSWLVPVLVIVCFDVVGVRRGYCKRACFINVFIIIIFTFYLPVLMLLCIYLKIFLVAQRQARSIQSTKSGAGVSRMEKKSTKTLAIVMGVFLISWSPFFLFTNITSFHPVSMQRTVAQLLNWLALVNSLFNPFIYAFFYRWFRSAFRIIITGKIIQGNLTNSKLH